MLSKLMHVDSGNENSGIIWSLEGGHCVAFEISPAGKIVKKAKHTFKGFSLAQDWLRSEGVKNISLHQLDAYLEMIGQASESDI